MDNAGAAKSIVEFLVVGYVIAVGEVHVFHAAQFFDSFY
jgi:hypothetical protein